MHPSDLIDSRWHEQSDYDNVQASCFIDLPQEIAAILQDNELDKMPDWIRSSSEQQSCAIEEHAQVPNRLSEVMLLIAQWTSQSARGRLNLLKKTK